MQTILIIEDEKDIADLIAMSLERAGFRVICKHDGKQGLDTALAELPHLIVLDLMLPSLNGVGVLKKLRNNSETEHTPVILLTARAQTEDRIAGLAAGADDYVTKPFSPKELVLRVQAILKRISTSPTSSEKKSHDFILDSVKMQLRIKEEMYELTSTEFKMLSLLLAHPEKTITRNEMLKTVWGYSDDVISRTLDTHIKRLRQKLDKHAACFETIRGIGFRFTPSP